MKAIISSAAALLLSGAPVIAQTDTTRAAGQQESAVRIEYSSKEGVGVQMESGDTTRKDGGFTIETKNRIITISSTPRPWASETDSIAELLRDKRRQRRRDFTYWTGLDIGANFLVGPDGDADLDEAADFMQLDHGRSRFFAMNLLERKVEFGSHHAGLYTGLGWEFVNYRLKSNSILAYEGDSVFGVPLDQPRMDKNKLRQMGIRMPLMLEFNTRRAPLPTADDVRAMRSDTTGTVRKRFSYDRSRNVHLAFGVVGSWYFDTMYKQRYEVDGDLVQDRDKGDYNLLPYRLAAAVRLGYGALNLFAEYSLTPLFREGRGPELTPVTVGITLVGFN